MKGTSKKILLAVCIIALVMVAVMGTLAYFTDKDFDENTFTVGKVYIDLDEEDTDDSTPAKDRDKANKYHLIPGSTYDKDPTVHVEADSEPAWLFVKVVNKIKDIEADSVPGSYSCIEDQLKANGWQPLAGETNVYYQAHSAKADTVRDYVVFEEFKIDGGKAVNDEDEADNIKTFYIDNYNTKNNAESVITVTAYAIQMAGFEGNPSAAWDAFTVQNS